MIWNDFRFRTNVHLDSGLNWFWRLKVKVHCTQGGWSPGCTSNTEHASHHSVKSDVSALHCFCSREVKTLLIVPRWCHQVGSVPFSLFVSLVCRDADQSTSAMFDLNCTTHHSPRDIQPHPCPPTSNPASRPLWEVTENIADKTDRRQMPVPRPALTLQQTQRKVWPPCCVLSLLIYCYISC